MSLIHLPVSLRDICRSVILSHLNHYECVEVLDIPTALKDILRPSYSSRSKIKKFCGGWGSRSGRISLPFGVSAFSNGDVVVCEGGNHRIQIFSAIGESLLVIGSKGGGEVQFQEPSDVAVSGDDEIYVADRWNVRIQVISRDGSYIRSLREGMVGDPQGVCVTSGEYGIQEVFVATCDPPHILCYSTSNSHLIRSLLTQPSPQTLREPRHISHYSHRLYISDYKLGCVIVMSDRDGEVIRRISAVNWPVGVTVDRAGNVLVTEGGWWWWLYGRRRLTVLNRKDEKTEQIGEGQLGWARAVTAMPDDRILVCDTWNHIIWEI